MGFLWGVGNIITVFAHVVVIIWLIYFVAFGALCAAPIWSIWEGVFLLRIARQLEISTDTDETNRDNHITVDYQNSTK